MATQSLTEKYAESLNGVLGCFDRIVITGSLAELCYAKGQMESRAKQAPSPLCRAGRDLMPSKHSTRAYG